MLVSIGTAYLVMQFQSIMDYVQALFSFFIAPLFGTVLLGMLWKRATPPGGFWGLLAGTVSSIGMWAWVKIDPRRCAISSRFRRMPRTWRRICTARSGAWIDLRGGNGVVSYHDEAASRSSELTGWFTAAPRSLRKGDLPL